jgi:hypothetical protein
VTGWQCAACDTYNGVNDAACHVCNGARRVTAKPPPPPEPPLPPPRAQLWVPPMEPPPFSAPYDRRSRTRRRAVTATLAVALVGGGVVAGTQLTSRAHTADPPSTVTQATTSFTTGDADPTNPASPTFTATTSEPSPTTPATVGLVDITEVAGSPDATAVATTLDTYFSGVNDKDFTRATSVFDPAGILNPGSPAQVEKLAHDDQTSTLSDVAVHSIDADTAGRVKAVATFQSTQSAGFGPRSRPSETCTRWAVTYTMTGSASSGYRILRGDGSNRPC